MKKHSKKMLYIKDRSEFGAVSSGVKETNLKRKLTT